MTTRTPLRRAGAAALFFASAWLWLNGLVLLFLGTQEFVWGLSGLFLPMWIVGALFCWGGRTVWRAGNRRWSPNLLTGNKRDGGTPTEMNPGPRR